MRSKYFIALDVHCSFSELAAVNDKGKLVKRDRCETSIPDLVEAIEAFGRPRFLTFEEGPLADWLARNLEQHADGLIVCEPRRNRLIAKEGDKDDAVDAEKLAQLFRGNYLKAVHQTGSLERSLLKQQVSFYHDRVRDRVRQGHEIVAQLRRHGIFTTISKVVDETQRAAVWEKLPKNKILRRNLELLLQGYEVFTTQEEEIRENLLLAARRQKLVRRFADVPGFALIRAVTFYVFVDTPWRFRSHEALWRYCGIGLKRRHSGKGKVKTLRDEGGNRRLKDVFLGAARTAASGDNAFADKYRYWTEEESMHPATARRNVARSLARVLWTMWKMGSAYDPALVRGVGRPLATGLAS
jgi:transposase